MKVQPEHLPLRILQAEEAEAMAEHLLRQMADSGLQGGIVFNPYEPGQQPSVEDLVSGRRQRYQRSLREPGWGRAFVAEDRGRPIAHVELETLSVASIAHRATLSIGLEPAFRGQGLGLRLSQFALDWAREQSPLEWIDLHVFAHNHAALALYRRLGFESVGVTRDRIRVAGQSIDDIHMTLQLKPTVP